MILNKKTAQKLLKNSGGRVTRNRLAILSILLENKAALNHQELKYQAASMGLNLDRVTLYRTLDWLIAQGIAHKIQGKDRAWHYSAQVTGNTSHAHFHCKQCNRIYCIEKLHLPVISMPDPAFRVEDVEINLRGYCPACV